MTWLTRRRADRPTLTSQTLWDPCWAATRLLEPVYDALFQHLRAGPVIGVDQTSWPDLETRRCRPGRCGASPRPASSTTGSARTNRRPPSSTCSATTAAGWWRTRSAHTKPGRANAVASNWPPAGRTCFVRYTLRIWRRLTAFVDSPEVWLDNNATERGLRGPVIGRRNHFGSKSARGTQMAAILYTLIETAKASGVDPISCLIEAATRARRMPDAVLLPTDVQRPA